MTGEAAAAPKEEEEAKAVAGVVEAASAEEAEAMSIEEATARHVIQCSTLVFPPREEKRRVEFFWGATPTCPPLRPQTNHTHIITHNKQSFALLPAASPLSILFPLCRPRLCINRIIEPPYIISKHQS